MSNQAITLKSMVCDSVEAPSVIRKAGAFSLVPSGLILDEIQLILFNMILVSPLHHWTRLLRILEVLV